MRFISAAGMAIQDPMRLAMLVILVTIFGGASARAHEGHDHGAPPPPVTTTIAPRADASSPDFELVAIARGTTLRIYLDTFRGNEPVEDAGIEVDGPGGTVKAAAISGGAYTIDAPWIAQPGTHALAFTVQARGTIDVLTATLIIPEVVPSRPVTGGSWSRGGSFAWTRDIAARLAAGDASLWIVGAGSFLAGMLVTWRPGRRRGVAAGFALALLVVPIDARAAGTADAASAIAGRDVAQRFADGAVFVPKTTQRILAIRTLFTELRSFAGTVELPARIIPDPDAAGFVQAAVAGRLAPPPGGFPRLGMPVAAGDVLALVQPAIGAADVTSQQQQARELDQQIALVERRLERSRQIQNVVARAQIEDAELELRGLRIRRANLERSPREPEKLVAPVSGVIAAARAIAGQIAEPNALIFQIVDPARLWVEASSFEVHSLAAVAHGRLGDGRTVPLAYRGSGLSERNQAIAIQFSVEGPTRGLRVGQLLTVLASTGDERSGIAVPRTSVLRGANGQAIVYEHTNAERFLPREVRVEPLDGDQVLIVAGMEAGRRIVTQGAELLNQIR